MPVLIIKNIAALIILRFYVELRKRGGGIIVILFVKVCAILFQQVCVPKHGLVATIYRFRYLAAIISFINAAHILTHRARRIERERSSDINGKIWEGSRLPNIRNADP